MNFLEKSATEAQEGRYSKSEKYNDETRKLLSRIACYNGQYTELNAVMTETDELKKALDNERNREREPNSKIINHYFERDMDRNARTKESDRRDRRRSRSRSRSPEYQISRKQTRPDNAAISFFQRKNWHVGKIPKVNEIFKEEKEKKINAVTLDNWTVEDKKQNKVSKSSSSRRSRSPVSTSRSPSPKKKKNKASKSPSPTYRGRSRSPVSTSRSPSPKKKKNKTSKSPSPTYRGRSRSPPARRSRSPKQIKVKRK